ncbi:hypothetical protein UT300012_40100 [Paraclostridium bifermentans]
MFEYLFASDFTVLTPFCTDIKQIKKETKVESGFIHDISIYPNGFIVENFQYPDKVIVKTNMELIDNNDGTFSVKI